jgi:2-polyprenyl-6-methoxyphenol hydroxylase-like FAD-dependent oxidoreductase
VRIVDKAPARTDKSKALVLWSRTLELLERGPGSARFIDAGFKASAVNMISGDKLIGHVDMSSLETHNYALMLPQADTERLLEEYLARNCWRGSPKSSIRNCVHQKAAMESGLSDPIAI